MVVKNQYFIVLLMTLSLFIGNSKAGWKFWKKDKETTTTTTTTTPVSVNVQTTTISELGTNIDVSKSNIPGFGRGDDQSYRKWAVDPIGTREPSQNQPSKIPQGSTINSDGSRPFPETMNQSAASRTSITNQLDSRSTSVSGNMAVESTQLSVAGRDERRTTSERSTQPAQSNQYNRPALPRDVRTNVVTDATTRAVADFTTKMYSSNPTYSKGNIVTDEDLEKLSEALYIKETNNANPYITVNLQKQTTSSSLMDQAPQPLLTISTEAFQIPTIQRVLSIFDNYQLDTLTNEYINPAQRQEESLLLDTFLSTNVMSTAMRFLADKGFMRRDYYEYKDILRRIWFNLFSRGQGKIGSTGFEHVFMAETKQVDSDIQILGLHNWIYFNAEEIKRRADYLGYIKKTDLGNVYIGTRYDKINDHIRQLTETKECGLRCVCKKSFLVTRHCIRSTENRMHILWTAMHLHSQLCRIAFDINSLFKMQMTLQTMSHFVTLTTVFYMQYHVMLCLMYNGDAVSWKFLLSTYIWIAFDLIRLISLNYICESVSAKAQKTEGIIHKLTNLICFAKAREEICQFVLQISLRPLKFSGMGLFYFGHKFLYKFFVWVLSVIIIVIQMDTSPRYQIVSKQG